jgi:hypothetical protein
MKPKYYHTFTSKINNKKFMYKFKVILGFISLFLFSNCATTGNSLGTALTPEAQIKNLLNNGANAAFGIFGGEPNNFLTHILIDAVMPKELKEINNKLTQMGLNSVVEKQKNIIGNVAKSSLVLMKPLVSNAIKNITPTEAISLISAKKGSATNYLRKTTEEQLIKSLTPIVSTELNKYGATKMLNTALGGSNILDSLVGGLLGNKSNNSNTSNQLETLVTKQLVNGLYNVMLDSEMKNNIITNGINTILNGGN